MAMKLCMVDKCMEMLPPAMKTPKRRIYLSEMDLYNDAFVITLMTYKANHANQADPAEVLRNALAKSLVSFYPLAGRIQSPRSSGDDYKNGQEQSRPEIVCEGQGALFIKGNIECNLEDIDYLTHPLRLSSSSLRALCPLDLPPGLVFGDLPLLRFQVTRFKCGGFVVGVAMSHVVIDGSGHSNFMKHLGEIARTKNGQVVSSPNPTPVWDGKLIPHGKRTSTKFIDTGESRNHVPFTMCSVTFSVTSQGIQTMKNNIVAESQGSLKYCTTFEVVTSLVWKAFIKSTKLRCDGYYFHANIQDVISQSLPKGYGSNCVVPIVVYSDGNEDEVDIVRATRKAKERLSEEYVLSYLQHLTTSQDGKYGAKWFESFMAVYDWRHFHMLPDFGWGKAMNLFVVPLPRTETFILPSKVGSKSINVLTFLPAEAMPDFAMELEEAEGIEDLETSSMSLDVCPMPWHMSPPSTLNYAS